MARPPFLEPICLYEFASIWALAPASKNEGNDDEDLIEFPEAPPDEHFFQRMTDREAYYYSLILMYWPFRKEDFCDESAPSVVFQQKHPEFRTSVHSPVIRRDLCEEIDRAILRISEFTENENDEANIECPFDPPFEEQEDNLLDIPSQQEVFPEVAPNMNITETCKQAEGGTGKTHCLKTLTLLIRNYWPGDCLIIAAPTGFIKTYQKLNARKLAEFRRIYSNVRWIFIDEISMVSYENFRAIHLRLCEIFNTEGVDPFANKNVVIWGDLLQLPPPKATRIFMQPSVFSAEVNLWRQF
ncbi:ATP-dependent DNA helicase PIF6 [Folsomia candida]|uniref:ATP-dependent DNA helicase n=1 Tax=Folsomia candida TaxID=158441 RepID=A0A226DZ18_FOLCA|nr:ATP-dependent DNA helicase PIF6 [Folsomia candida]